MFSLRSYRGSPTAATPSFDRRDGRCGMRWCVVGLDTIAATAKLEQELCIFR